ncbi:uncharacterized protein FIESC28_11738 [Fusarium coffeatum]|uniref:Uncharacterized protein n=1 Tax=Fusarium coffeatum TaxID=231269 RepID=A0A366QF85_9HYPO|nr:uncharacterized protein FIESC28_11738 [Fusarium coffeatum]RBR03581.1 hypothetical protein FIESC28_11738 [Fusarium coffeatum]
MESLPSEVLHNIFSSFCSYCQGVTPIFRADDIKIVDFYKAVTNSEVDRPIHYHRQTLCSLSRVSRQIRQIAQPILHYQFDIILRSPIAEPQNWRLEPFLRTITARLDLARLVAYLNIGSDMVAQLDIKAARRVYLQALKTLGVGVDKILAKRAENTNPDLEIPRPMPFEFAEYDLNGSVFKDRYMFLKQFLLENCESSVCAPPLKEVATTELMMVLLALPPNLETLVINDNFFEGSMMSTALEAFGVTSLNLKSVVSIQFPCGIVKISPHLQSLIIGDVKKPVRIPHAGTLFYWGHVADGSNRIAAKDYHSLTLIDSNREAHDFPYTILKDGLQKLAAARSTFSCLKKIRCDLEYSKYDSDTKQTFALLGVDFVYETFEWKTGMGILGTVEWPFGRADTPESFLDPRERESKELFLSGEMEFSDEEDAAGYAMM